MSRLREKRGSLLSTAMQLQTLPGEQYRTDPWSRLNLQFQRFADVVERVVITDEAECTAAADAEALL
jgi:hypothetical protein